MRVLLSTWDSRGGVEPLAGLAVQSRALARAGAPQVVMPQGADQVYWAGRVAELGIGTAYEGRTATIEKPRSRRPWPPRPAPERARWRARSAPTGRWWPRRC